MPTVRLGDGLRRESHPNDGTVPLSEGPMVLTVKADGNSSMIGE
ncbi:hypothetical protein [Cryobacterium sp. AP23]